MTLRAFDHFLVVVKDLEDAHQRYMDLGFTVVPPQQHVNVGSANCVIQFENTYFELFGQIDQIRPSQWHAFYMARLALGEGIGNISFTADKLVDEQTRLRAKGLTIFEPLSAKRAVPLPSGRVLETDSSSVYTENDGRLYLSPFFSEHRKPETIFVPELQRHANAVTDMIGVIAVSNDVNADADYMATLAEVEQVEAINGGKRLHLARGHFIDLLTAPAVEAHYGDAATFSMAKGGMVIGLVCKSADLRQTETVLDTAGIEVMQRNNLMTVGHTSANGIFLQFQD